MIANPENFAILASNLLHFPDRMNIWQRMFNLVHTVYSKWEFYTTTNVQTDYMRKYIDPKMPTIREVENSVAMILANSHMSMNGMRPITPALVEVGGLHVQEEGVHLSPVSV